MLSLLLALLLAAAAEPDARTVIGPSNPNLADGSQALLAGDAEEGVRLTHLGLSSATGSRDRIVGLANLCAGYAMLGEYEKGLQFCDQAIEINEHHWRAFSNRALIYVKLGRFEEAEADLAKGEALAPNARNLKAVRAMLLDETDPVTPSVIIDDRRSTGADE